MRTIHLSGNKLLSGQDPLSGHHHACNPLRIHSRMEEMDEGERYDRDDDVEMYKKHGYVDYCMGRRWNEL